MGHHKATFIITNKKKTAVKQAKVQVKNQNRCGKPSENAGNKTYGKVSVKRAVAKSKYSCKL